MYQVIIGGIVFDWELLRLMSSAYLFHWDGLLALMLLLEVYGVQHSPASILFFRMHEDGLLCQSFGRQDIHIIRF